MRRPGFDQELTELQHELIRMGNLVQEAIALAVESLAKQDLILAQQVLDGDDAIDKLELDIEDRCMKLIARQQPMAKDLRKIGTGLKIITDLERMGDHAADIAKITLRIGDEPLIKPLIDIPRMAALSQKMLKDCLNAYIQEDVEKALQICRDDDEVDHLFGQVFRELLTYMMEDPHTISQATHLLFVGRYLERIADHTTNIAEWVIYQVTGERKELNL